MIDEHVTAAIESGAKIGQQSDGLFVLLDMPDTPLWFAAFRSESEAAQAYLTWKSCPFDLKTLTDDQLTECLYEMRDRGAAVAYYDVAEILTMTDGWDNQPTEQQVRDWFDRWDIEEAMCEAVNSKVNWLVGNLDDA